MSSSETEEEEPEENEGRGRSDTSKEAQEGLKSSGAGRTKGVPPCPPSCPPARIQGSATLRHLDFRFRSPRNCERTHFSFLKLPSLWSCVLTPTGTNAGPSAPGTAAQSKAEHPPLDAVHPKVSPHIRKPPCVTLHMAMAPPSPSELLLTIWPKCLTNSFPRASVIASCRNILHQSQGHCFSISP